MRIPLCSCPPVSLSSRGARVVIEWGHGDIGSPRLCGTESSKSRFSNEACPLGVRRPPKISVALEDALRS